MLQDIMEDLPDVLEQKGRHQHEEEMPIKILELSFCARLVVFIE